uniref:Uncharacterized protein n=1 Tax=Arundo donax TaxID=35708 RepID=A0A0A9LWI6_ARUDO
MNQQQDCHNPRNNEVSKCLL